ncbi:MAG: VCBS repeat-containing protein, partial [Ferruginibacter sp.]
MFISTQSAAPASYFTTSGSARWLLILLLLSFLGISKTRAQAYCPALYATNSPTAAQGIVEADFNGDGKPDLVTAHYNETNGSPNAVSMLLNNGSGGFATGILYAVGGRPVSMAVGDFNGDGKPDLVTANGRANSTISVLMNNGIGGFLPKTDYAPMIYNTRVAVGDFNNDGKPDIVVMGSGGTGIMVLLNNGSGGFNTGIYKQLGAANANLDLTVGDFDKDGRLDVVAGVSYTNNQGVAVNQVQVLKGNGGGDFSIFSALAYAVGGPAVSLAVGDVNGDGNLDLATVNAGVVSVQLGSTNNYFGPKTDFTVGDNPSTVLVKDFNK